MRFLLLPPHGQAGPGGLWVLQRSLGAQSRDASLLTRILPRIPLLPFCHTTACSLLAAVAGEGPSSQPCVLNLMSFNMQHSEPGRDWQREQSSVPAPRSYKSIGDTCWDR